MDHNMEHRIRHASMVWSTLNSTLNSKYLRWSSNESLLLVERERESPKPPHTTNEGKLTLFILNLFTTLYN